MSIMADNMAQPVISQSGSDVDEGKLFAVLAYLLGLVGILIVFLAKKDNKFAVYHAKQSICLVILAIGGYIGITMLSFIMGFIPIIGWIFGSLVWFAFSIACLIFIILGVMNALNGQMKPLPVIGVFADKINL